MDNFSRAKRLKIFELIINLISGAYCLVFSAFVAVIFLFSSGFVYLWDLEYDDEVVFYLGYGIGYGVLALLILTVFVLFLIFGISYIKGCSKMQTCIDPVVTYKKCKARQVVDICMVGFMIVSAPVMSIVVANLKPNIDGMEEFIITTGFTLSVFEVGALVLAIISLSLFKRGKAQVYGASF